jgi:hypothetical protein
MARRWRGNMNGQQYLGNTNEWVIHNLDSEDRTRDGCRIDEIIDAGNDRPFTSLVTALGLGYDSCGKCLMACSR